MAKLNDIAAKAAVNYSEVSGNKEAAIDIATIATFAELIIKVVDMLKECKKTPTTATDTVKAPGLFARLRLRSLVKDNMSRADFRDHGEQVIEALQKTGKGLTSEDLKQLL